MVDARLYAITPDRAPDEIVELVARWLKAGVTLVQLRQTQLRRGALLELATRLAQQTHASGAALVVNDQVDIALLAGADGVHLGPDDLSVAAARRVAGSDLTIGASAASPDAARAAEEAGADYLGSGPAFATETKPAKQVIGPEGIAAVAGAVSIPVYAIGGITPERVPELRAQGVERICAISALAGDDPGDAVAQFLEALR